MLSRLTSVLPTTYPAWFHHHHRSRQAHPWASRHRQQRPVTVREKVPHPGCFVEIVFVSLYKTSLIFKRLGTWRPICESWLIYLGKSIDWLTPVGYVLGAEILRLIQAVRRYQELRTLETKSQLQNYTAHTHKLSAQFTFPARKEANVACGAMELLSYAHYAQRGGKARCRSESLQSRVTGNTPWNSFAFHSQRRIVTIFFLRSEQRWHFPPLGLERGQCTFQQ